MWLGSPGWHEHGSGERSLFDLTFYLIITVTLLAIVSGVIIDSFGALRDRDTAVRAAGGLIASTASHVCGCVWLSRCVPI